MNQGEDYAAVPICLTFEKNFVNSCKKIENMNELSGTERRNINPGLSVSIVLKQDQRTGKLTKGIVKDILTSAPKHTHGIKVRLVTGEVGRVKIIG